jgi:hypothetical protein
MPAKEPTRETILYNVTVSLEPTIELDWLLWIQSTHIPEVLKTRCFSQCVISKVNGIEPDECTYSILYWALDQTTLEKYFRTYAEELQKDHKTRFDGQFVAFRTTMNLINTIVA